jgi:hypothetical protein
MEDVLSRFFGDLIGPYLLVSGMANRLSRPPSPVAERATRS